MDLEIDYFMSEDEVAKELGICRSRVNTIQKKATKVKYFTPSQFLVVVP